MVDTASENPDVVTFPAAGDWNCSYIAWLPHDASAERDALQAAARRGILLIDEGRLRRRALKLLDQGALDILETPPLQSRVIRRYLPVANPDGALAMQPGGRFVDVIVPGRLDADLLPLWVSMAVACGVAAAGQGSVLDAASLRELAPEMLTKRIPARPRIALGEHVLLLSSSDDRGVGRLTTMGLLRLGLPEITIEDVPDETLCGIASIVNGLAWRIFEEALATPIVSGGRHVSLPADLLVPPSWTESAFGRCPDCAPRLRNGEEAPPRVRLAFAPDEHGLPWIRLGPPLDWSRTRDAWARALVRRSGHSFVPLPHSPPVRSGSWPDDRRH